MLRAGVIIQQATGSIYSVEKDTGYITYPGWSTPSGQWVCLGAVRFNNFGREVERCIFAELYRLNGQWKHRNGKQKWHVTDLDHGTKRVWMSPDHEGRFSEEGNL